MLEKLSIYINYLNPASGNPHHTSYTTKSYNDSPSLTKTILKSYLQNSERISLVGQVENATHPL